MLYYRRKIILALIELCGDKVSAKRFQKLLFLFTRLQAVKSFDFVPYKYGCFSFQANQDVLTLATYGYLSINETDSGKLISIEKKGDYAGLVKDEDIKYLRQTLLRFGGLKQIDLIKYTYKKYPFYAINSSIASSILSDSELDVVSAQKKHYDDPMLFSIGYEGITLEKYINTLLIKDVRVLCDVRKNAFSQKYGFSKKQLSAACNGVGLIYLHIPELGIESAYRKELNSAEDYSLLFDSYEKNTLVNRDNELYDILELIESSKRIALTCFEKNPNECHRTRVANKLIKLSGGRLKLTNL